MRPWRDGRDVIGPNDSDETILSEKWRLLPEFLKVRGLVKQHIDSYNYLIDHEIKKIVTSDSTWFSDIDKRFFVKYKDVRIGSPQIVQENTVKAVTPHTCRLRNLTYHAPIKVDIVYTKHDIDSRLHPVEERDVLIGYIPVMLRSRICVLNGASEEHLARFQECPHDPGGYFIVKGTEKVILIQEQLSKNRIIIEEDSKGMVFASITSSTNERKSRTAVVIKDGVVHLRHNCFTQDIPIAIVFKAMGVVSDQEFVSMIGITEATRKALFSGIKDAHDKDIRTQEEALDWIGSQVRGSILGFAGTTRSSAEVKTEFFLANPVSQMQMDSPTSGKDVNQGANTTANLQKYFYRTRADEARDLLATVVLSHVPVENFDFRAKAVYIAFVVRRCLEAQMNKKLVDDRDYYGNKRLELAGQLMSLLFEDLFKRFNSELKMEVDKILSKQNKAQAFDLRKHIRTHLITSGFVTAISSGNWSIKRFKMERSGITQQVTRLSYMSAIGHMTRISSQFEKTRKVSGPRSLQPSQWGMLCPSDTPEGESCGLVKNLSLLTHVTTDQDPAGIINLCMNGLGVINIKSASAEDIFSPSAFVILLNGLLLGIHLYPKKFARNLRKLRREGRLGEFVSVFVDDVKKYVLIASDEGRVCRPLIIVEKGKSKLTAQDIRQLGKTKVFKNLIEEGKIEYIDVNESNNTMIALRESEIQDYTTHLEIDPLTILGVVAGLIPYPHHNQSPRNTYQCAMGKQAIGTIGMNQYNRIDTLLYLMVYPQRPLVTTRTLDLVNFDNVPGGQNAVVAVMSYSGYDIEDATIMNKASLDRGYGRCIVLKKFATSLQTYSNQTKDRIVPYKPPEVIGPDGQPKRRPVPKKYEYLESDGFVGVGMHVPNGTVLVNREAPKATAGAVDDPFSTTLEYRPAPLSYKGPGSVSIDKVMVTENESEGRVIKVLIRDVRRPELGDKFSSRHGQKGVCGLIVNQGDMPFNRDGICPDMIMNPHGFPSRMTVGKTIEFIAGKASVLDGFRRYGTAFSGSTVQSCSEELIKRGYSYSGKDILTSGITGEPIGAYIFMGPVFYQKLKHMVMDKLHARARGPRAALTRQPTEGRSRDGGLRLGEMERDCLIGYGGGGLLLERLMISSDQFTATICTKCGLIARPEWCNYCRASVTLTNIEIPYACKLLFQELASMNINCRIFLQDR